MLAGGRVAERLTWYWQAEVANAVFVPASFIALAYLSGGSLGWPTYTALVPVCGLLVVGGLYWRGKLHALKGDRAALDTALALADRGDRPLLAVTLAALGVAFAGFIMVLPGSTDADRWGALAAALLAAAEYANYYWRQLQHFDNRADFVRLVRGEGFRPAKLALDLRAWRAARRT